MRISSTLLAGVSRLCRLAQPEAGDTEILIPSSLVPVAEMPEVWQSMVQGTLGSLATAVQPDSGFISYNRSRAAAAALEVTRIGALGPGLWELFWHIAAFAGAATNAISISCNMGTPSGSGGNSFQVLNILPIGTLRNEHFYFFNRITVPANHSFLIEVSIDNAAGATAAGMNVGIICNRLVG